jgi:site-specific recombinase XerC
MDITKVKKSLTSYENYLVVEKMVSVETAKGYSRSLSIALRRIKKFKPSYDDVMEYVVWLQKKL